MALLAAATNVMAADASLAKELATKSNFKQGIIQYMRGFGGGMPKSSADRFVRKVNLNKIEDTYVKGIAANMSNEEVNALIKAYDIPGFRSALAKQGLVAAGATTIIVKELQRALQEMAKEK